MGGVDVGIIPLAVDSGGEPSEPWTAHYQPDSRTASGQWEYPNPRGYGECAQNTPPVAACPIAARTGQPGLVGGTAPYRRAHRRAKGLRDNAQHHISRALVQKYHTLGIETLNVGGHDQSWPTVQGPWPMPECLVCWSRSGTKPSGTAPALWRRSQWYPSSKTCSACGVVNTELGQGIPVGHAPAAASFTTGTRTQPATCRNLRYSR